MIGPRAWQLTCCLLLAVTAGAWPHAAGAAVTRFALLVGANEGHAHEAPLRYAEADARRIGGILERFGGFTPAGTTLLTAPTADGLRRALGAVDQRVRAAGGDDSLLVVFYSGHADAEALHLGGTVLPLAELRAALERSPARVKVLVLDACRSGAVTRVKGGRPGPAFRIELDDTLAARGMAILTSSAAGELSQESDQLRASFFTHFLASALIGAADSDDDGRVSLGEAFSYAATQTLAATASTVQGPQHPTYRLELGGRQHLILTRPGLARGRFGTLRFADPGHFVVRRAGTASQVVAEIVVDRPGGQLTLPPGAYEVVYRVPERVLQGRFAVARQATTEIGLGAMRAVERAVVATKGEAAPPRSRWSLFATGGARGGVLEHAVTPSGALGVGLDLGPLELEAAIRYGASSADLGVERVDDQEVGVTLGLAKRVPVGPLELGAALHAGVLWFDQTRADGRGDRQGTGLVAAVDVQLVAPLGRVVFLRLTGGVALMALRAAEGGAEASVEVPITWRSDGGIGVRF